MDEKDELEFAEIVLSSPNVVFLPQVSNTNPLPEFRSLADANVLEHRLSLQIWNKMLTESLTIEQYAPNIFSTGCIGNDLLIGLSRSFSRGTILVAGEISAEMYSLDKISQQFVYKGKDFEKWYNKLARWIRNNYERDPKYGFCIGPSAKQALDRGKITLAQHMTLEGPI